MVGPEVLSILARALTVALVVAPPAAGPDDDCPSARQVGDAMQARFGASLIAPETAGVATRPDVLRSVLDVAGDGTVVRFSLVDARGETQLRRTLPAAGRSRANNECLALADTLAAIVERYLSGIAYNPADPLLPASTPPTVGKAADAPASAETGRGALALVGFGWRMPRGTGGDPGEWEARLGAQVELTRATPRLLTGLSVGVAPAAETELTVGDSTRTISLRRFPLRLAALLAVPAGAGWVEPTVEAGVDLLIASSSAGRRVPASRSTGFAFGMEAAVGYRLKIVGAWYARPRITVGLAARRYVDVEGFPYPLFSTPRGYASFGIDTGFLFR